MACSIKFVRLNDFAADIDVLDLSTDGYALDQDGYFPVVAPIGAKSVHEVLTLKLQGTSKDDLATMTQDIDEKIKQVQWWIDAPGVERYQVWMRVQLENETYPRQAQILNITPPDKLRVFVPEEINNNYIGAYSLGIERTPFWEMPYPYPTTTDKTTISSLGGKVQLSETINGDVPARLAKLSMAATGSGLGITHPPNDYWIGFKTSRLGGDVSKLVSRWLFSSSQTRDTDTTIVGDDAVCDFGDDATLIDRTVVWTALVTADADAQNAFRGTYNVLLRAKMSDTSVARVRLVYGSFGINASSTARTYRSRVIVSGTSYSLYDVGTVSVPPTRATPNYSIAFFGIIMQAERISGAGSLSMNSLIFIPNNEGFVKAGSDSTTTVATSDYLSIFQSPDEQVYSFVENASSVLDGAIVSPNNWGLPANNEAPYIIMASSSRTYFSESMNLTISYTYIPRWRTLRGSVT